MVANELAAASNSPAMIKVDALLAARQPCIAVSVMVAMLDKAIERFATTTGISMPRGDVYARASMVLDRASKTCVNPTLAARLSSSSCAINVARANVTTKLKMEGAELLRKALMTTLPVLESPGLAKLVKLNIALHAVRTGEPLLETSSEQRETQVNTPRKSKLMDPLLAGGFFCGITGAWAIMGAVVALSIQTAIIGLAWLFVAFVLYKMRSFAKVKLALVTWNEPRSALRITLAILACAALAVFLPLVTTSWHATSNGTPIELGTTASLFTLLVDPQQDSWVLVVKMCTIGMMIFPIVLVLLAARCKVEGMTWGKKTRDYNIAKVLLFCTTVIAWLAIIAWQNEQGAWYPSSTWSDGYVTITTMIGVAWYLIGLVAVFAA
ncbi:MAG TPA: hypothetical protein VKM55_13790 [Candidatus Lokiarchaeia archaeon]|nr:hypothetical protein [Candidatus Lokiarchaeia archaeon]